MIFVMAMTLFAALLNLWCAIGRDYFSLINLICSISMFVLFTLATIATVRIFVNMGKLKKERTIHE